MFRRVLLMWWKQWDGWTMLHVLEKFFKMCEVSILPTSTNNFLTKDLEIFVGKSLIPEGLSKHTKHASKFILLVHFCDFCKEILFTVCWNVWFMDKAHFSSRVYINKQSNQILAIVDRLVHCFSHRNCWSSIFNVIGMSVKKTSFFPWHCYSTKRKFLVAGWDSHRQQCNAECSQWAFWQLCYPKLLPSMVWLWMIWLPYSVSLNFCD